MNKKYLIAGIAGAIVFGAVLIPLAIHTVAAQSDDSSTRAQTLSEASTTQIAVQVSTLSTMVSELASIEAGRQAIGGTVGGQIAQISAQVQGIASMPMNTPAERSVIANDLGQVGVRVSNLATVVQGMAGLQNQEMSILGQLQIQLVDLKNEL